MKIPVLETDKFILYLEDNEGAVFIHCDIKTKWSKEIKKELEAAFKVLTTEWNKELFALHVPSDKKHEKFLKMFDFKFFKTIKGFDNNDYDIYVWR